MCLDFKGEVNLGEGLNLRGFRVKWCNRGETESEDAFCKLLPP